MRTTKPPTANTPSRFFIRLICLLVLAVLGGLEAKAVSPCTIGLPNVGTSTPVINGIKSTDWNDASLLKSGDPCLEELGDGEPLMTAKVEVYSKIFGTSLGFYFAIPDTTQGGPCTAGRLCVGDRIVLQFDSNKSRTATLVGGTLFSQTADYQIVITHKGRDIATGGVIDLEMKFFARDSFCSTPVWDDITSTVTTNQPVVSVRSDQPVPGTGYSAEIQIPLAFLGSPDSDFGFAFAIVNDIGSTTCTTNVCDSYAISFPDSITISNAVNPLVAGCSGWGDWIRPDRWATAIFGPAVGMVTVSRLPDYWANDGLLVYKCSDTTTPNYEYYNNPPCQATLKANVNNQTGSATTRNVLFLWSPVGMGTPSSYNFIELREHVPLGTGITPVFTSLWNRVPHNQMAHPCVRVYILPDAFLATFPRDRIVTITTGTQVAQMEAAYGLSTAQWTQKNIHQVHLTTRPDCDLGCDSTGANVLPDFMRNRDEVAVALPASPQRLDNQTQTANDDVQRPLPLNFTRAASPFADAVGFTQQTDHRPPIVTKIGQNILMAREELNQFRGNNIIVQVRAVGFGRSPSNHTPRHNFLERLGGVIQIIPVSVLQQRGTVPFQFNVTNSDTEHTIFLLVDVSVPSGVTQPQIALDTGQKVYTANENRVFRGEVTMPGVVPPGFKHWGLSLHAGGSFPHGNLNNIFNPGPNFAIDLEYRINSTFSLEAIYGYHRFRGETFGAFTVSDLNVHQFSLNGKVYGSSSPVRPFFNFGGGAYVFTQGVSTHGGLNLGAGVQFDVTPTFAVEGLYNFHTVFTSGSNTNFSAVQGGVRFRF